MIAFILQTIALSLGVFLLGLFLGWLLKKLFCKNKSKVDSYNRDSNERADPSFATSNTQSEVYNTDKSIPVATKAAGVTAAVAGAATIAKSMSEDATNHTESISAVDDVDQAIGTIKDKTEAVSDFGEQALDKAKDELPNGDDISNIPEEKLDDIQASGASNVDETIDELKAKTEIAVESSDDAIEKVKSELPDSDTLSEKLEDIKSTVSDKAENLQDTADKVTEGITSSTDNLDTAKTAATAIAGVAATIAGASLANEESNDDAIEKVTSELPDSETLSEELDDIKSTVSDEAIEKVKSELPDSDTLTEELEDIKSTISDEAENLQDTADKVTEKVTSELPDADTLTEKLEDIKSTVSDEAENLQNTADKVTEEVTSSTDSLEDVQASEASDVDETIDKLKAKAETAVESSGDAIEKAKSELPDSDIPSEKLDEIKSIISDKAENLQAATAIAGVAATVAGASLANEQNNKKDSADISVEEKNNQATSGSASNKISKTGSHTSKRDIDYTAVNTVHRTLRRRHRSCRCRK